MESIDGLFNSIEENIFIIHKHFQNEMFEKKIIYFELFVNVWYSVKINYNILWFRSYFVSVFSSM